MQPRRRPGIILNAASYPWKRARRLSWLRHGAEAIDELGEPAAVVWRAIQPFSGEPRVRWGGSLELSQALGAATSIRANSPPPRALFLTLQIETLIAALSDLYISLFVLYVFFGMTSFIYEPSTALIQRFLNWKCKSRAIALLPPTRISSGLENWNKRTAISAVLPKPHSRSTAPASFFTARAFQGIWQASPVWHSFYHGRLTGPTSTAPYTSTSRHVRP